MSRVPPNPQARLDVRKSSLMSTDEVRAAGSGREIPIDALETPPPDPDIELVTLARISQPDFDLQAFMEEKVTINVHKSNIEGDLAFCEPIVNGSSALIPRGRNVIVKRKFVEALANAKQAVYAQRVMQMDQQNIETPLEEQIALFYGFTLVNDTPRGRSWLNEVLAKAA